MTTWLKSSYAATSPSVWMSQPCPWLSYDVQESWLGSLRSGWAMSGAVGAPLTVATPAFKSGLSQAVDFSSLPRTIRVPPARTQDAMADLSSFLVSTEWSTPEPTTMT